VNSGMWPIAQPETPLAQIPGIAGCESRDAARPRNARERAARGGPFRQQLGRRYPPELELAETHLPNALRPVPYFWSNAALFDARSA
jgi:hypothetical protein